MMYILSAMRLSSPNPSTDFKSVYSSPSLNKRDSLAILLHALAGPGSQLSQSADSISGCLQPLQHAFVVYIPGASGTDIS